MPILVIPIVIPFLQITALSYLIRVQTIDSKMCIRDRYGINYNKWRICKDAIKKGEELKLPVYKFLEGPLVEKFGKAIGTC